MFTRSEKHDQSALRNAKPDDPVLAMRGLGKHLWKDECGDEFIKRERTGWRAGSRRSKSNQRRPVPVK